MIGQLCEPINHENDLNNECSKVQFGLGREAKGRD